VDSGGSEWDGELWGDGTMERECGGGGKLLKGRMIEGRAWVGMYGGGEGVAQ